MAFDVYLKSTHLLTLQPLLDIAHALQMHYLQHVPEHSKYQLARTKVDLYSVLL